MHVYTCDAFKFNIYNYFRYFLSYVLLCLIHYSTFIHVNKLWLLYDRSNITLTHLYLKAYIYRLPMVITMSTPLGFYLDSKQLLDQRWVMVGVIVGVLTLAQHWTNTKVSTVEVLLLAQRWNFNYAPYIRVLSSNLF